MDTVDRETRSNIMAQVASKDTGPEMFVRKTVHRAGFRFRLHSENLPGKPDLIFPCYKLAVFVHGCFWHGHECKNFRWPKSNKKYWHKKILGNRKRDEHNIASLENCGWHVRVIWECQLEQETAKLVEYLVEERQRRIASNNKQPI